MTDGCDSPAMQALIQATIEAESARENVSHGNSWHATVEEMLLPEFREPDLAHLKIGVDLSRKGRSQVHAQHFNKSRNPVKTVPPPKAISMVSATLTERIDSLQKWGLIGKWHFSEMAEEDMRKWLANKWTPLIGYIPVISRLMKDWFSFHFLKVSNLEIILNRPWVFGRSFLSLSRWYMGFDPLKNTPSNCMIWVKLPNLPLELWSTETLTEIGNSVGKFIYVDPWCRGEKDKRIAWILIEKPYKGGYPDHIEITWEGVKINQRLDFWGIPF